MVWPYLQYMSNIFGYESSKKKFDCLQWLIINKDVCPYQGDFIFIVTDVEENGFM